MREVSEETSIQCPVCGQSALAIQWDTHTQSKCFTRELKRAYKSILSKGALLKQKDFNYCCPYCDKYSRSNTLRILDINTDIEFITDYDEEY